MSAKEGGMPSAIQSPAPNWSGFYQGWEKEWTWNPLTSQWDFLHNVADAPVGPYLDEPMSPKDDDAATSEESFLGLVAADEEKRNQLWDHEMEVGYRSAGLTPLEKDALEKMTTGPDKSIRDANKVIAHFGKRTGAGASSKRLVEKMMFDKGFVPGQCINFCSGQFSVMKHCLLAGWAEDRHNSAAPVACYCLPETSLMPAGCRHKKRGGYLCSQYRQSLCSDCSRCMRCQRLLVFSVNGVGCMWKSD